MNTLLTKLSAFFKNVNPKVYAAGAATLPATQLADWLLSLLSVDWTVYANLHLYAVGAIAALVTAAAGWLKRDTRVAAVVSEVVAVVDSTPTEAVVTPIVDTTPVVASVTPEA